MMVKLGDCFDIIRNGASIKQTDGANGFPITRIETIWNREIDRNKFGYAGIHDINNYKDYILEDCDILMSHINSEKHLGKVAIYRKQGNEQIIHGMNLLMLRARQNILSPQYIVYYFETPYFLNQISRITKKSVNQASFNVTALKDLKIPLLSLEEQRKIAETLDKVSNLIAKRKDQIEKLDLLVKSKFVEMFGDINSSELYPYKKIKDFTIVISGGTPDRNNSDYWDNGCIPWVKTTELQNSLINESQEKITVDGMKNSSAKLVPPNTILLAMYGQGKTRGMTGYLGFESTTNQACACILPSETINQKYLWKYLIFSYDKLRNLAKGGNQPNLNCNMIKEFEVLFPPIEQQNKFADFVQQIEQSKILINKSLEKMETLKKALMQEYFG